MSKSFLDVEITEQPNVTVSDIIVKKVELKSGMQEKCVFKCATKDGREIHISDVYVEDKDGAQKIQGLWWNKDISPGSSVYKVLKYYNLGKLRDIIGKEVKVTPDPNDFLILAACDRKKVGDSSKGNLFD